MTLSLYNSFTGSKDIFKPIDPDHIRVYVCGPTVYDRAHIGNGRSFVVFDLLFRLLKRLYPRVTYVRNITDVDDKINAKAKELSLPIARLTLDTIRYFHEDMAALNCLAPTIEPHATDHIEAMIAMIVKLIEKNHAYVAHDHVLFSIDSMESWGGTSYGGLSKRSLESLIMGARVEIAPFKKHPADFVLWKPSGDDLPGWNSPWGRGRPGWHIECSAMSHHYLGEVFDIHGGGQDLIFPHHENEIAQSLCAHGTDRLASLWVHNGYLMVNGEKMSKSKGNFLTVHDLLAESPGEALRFYLLSTHYHHPLDWTLEGLKQAHHRLDKLYRALEGFTPSPLEKVSPSESLMAALEDNLNSPLALTILQDLASKVNKASDSQDKRQAQSELYASGTLLGLLQQDPPLWFQGQRQDPLSLSDEAIVALIEERQEAKKNKNFSLSDQIRDRLKNQGIILEDGPTGTKWRKLL